MKRKHRKAARAIILSGCNIISGSKNCIAGNNNTIPTAAAAPELTQTEKEIIENWRRLSLGGKAEIMQAIINKLESEKRQPAQKGGLT